MIFASGVVSACGDSKAHKNIHLPIASYIRTAVKPLF